METNGRQTVSKQKADRSQYYGVVLAPVPVLVLVLVLLL
jgi:hypothetical protein